MCDALPDISMTLNSLLSDSRHPTSIHTSASRSPLPFYTSSHSLAISFPLFISLSVVSVSQPYTSLHSLDPSIHILLSRVSFLSPATPVSSPSTLQAFLTTTLPKFTLVHQGLFFQLQMGSKGNTRSGATIYETAMDELPDPYSLLTHPSGTSEATCTASESNPNIAEISHPKYGQVQYNALTNSSVVDYTVDLVGWQDSNQYEAPHDDTFRPNLTRVNNWADMPMAATMVRNPLYLKSETESSQHSLRVTDGTSSKNVKVCSRHA